MEPEERFVGIDVSKKVLDIAVLPRDAWSVPNTPRGIDELVAALGAPGAGAGGAGIDGRTAAGGGGLAGADPDSNPRVRDFAKASGQLAKRLDAEVIAARRSRLEAPGD